MTPDPAVDPVLPLPMNEGRAMRNKVLAKFSSIPFQLHFLHHEFVIPRHLTSVGLFAEISDLGASASVRQVVGPPPSIPPHQKVQQAKGEGGRATSSIHPSKNHLRESSSTATRSDRRYRAAEGAVKAGKRYCSLLAPHPPPPFSPGAPFDSTCQILSCGLK